MASPLQSQWMTITPPFGDWYGSPASFSPPQCENSTCNPSSCVTTGYKLFSHQTSQLGTLWSLLGVSLTTAKTIRPQYLDLRLTVRRYATETTPAPNSQACPATIIATSRITLSYISCLTKQGNINFMLKK
jgi:hypothetical protein